MIAGPSETNGLNPEPFYVMYKSYVIPRMLYGFVFIYLPKLNFINYKDVIFQHLVKYRLYFNRHYTVYSFLRALPIKAEEHMKQPKLLYAVICNKCFKGRRSTTTRL